MILSLLFAEKLLKRPFFFAFLSFFNFSHTKMRQFWFKVYNPEQCEARFFWIDVYPSNDAYVYDQLKNDVNMLKSHIERTSCLTIFFLIGQKCFQFERRF